MSTLTHDAIVRSRCSWANGSVGSTIFFTVEGEASDEITIKGDATKVKVGWSRHDPRAHPGRRPRGMHLGAYMKGGTIDVSGNVTDWLGAEMTGGSFESAATPAARSEPPIVGSPSGMTDGTIIVDGTAGLEVGMRMKRGIIFIGGAVRTSPGADERRHHRSAEAPSCAPVHG